MNKAARYERIYQQISGLMQKCDDRQARMATVCAVLYHKMPYFFWTGFYLLKDERLIVATYQGPIACMELNKDQGVCWTCIRSDKTIIVADVHQFEGHIACDSRSKSDAEWLDKTISLITKL